MYTWHQNGILSAIAEHPNVVHKTYKVRGKKTI